MGKYTPQVQNNDTVKQQKCKQSWISNKYGKVRHNRRYLLSKLYHLGKSVQKSFSIKVERTEIV